MGKNSSTYRENLSVFMERFPYLGLQASSWEAKKTSQEPMPPIELGKAEALYIYGLGTGEVYFQVLEWLKSHPAKELIFLEDDPGAVASFLHLPAAFTILSDSQVHLALLTKGRKEIDALAERLPVRRVEVAALPSYRKKNFQSLRLKLLRKTTLTHALHLDRLHGYQPFKNFVQNLPQLPRSFYANALKGAFLNVPAVVCGAGPSLQHSIDCLRTLENKALIIAGGSTLAALTSQGILPHFGMAIDPNLEEYRRMKNSFAFEVPLLYSTRVFPGVFQTCNGPFGYMRCGIGGVPEIWMEEELGLLDPLIGDHLSPESISVTAICVAWAQFLGCNPILLNGVDLAYTGKKRYASGVVEDEEVPIAALDAEKSAADRIVKRKDRLGNPIYTAVRWIMESASISHFAKMHPEIQFINTTEGGIGFKGIEYAPLSRAAAAFSNRPSLRTEVHRRICESPMPANTEEIAAAKMTELSNSLDRIVDCLKILSGQEKGSSALAEMELKEEMAYPYLFYDIEHILIKETEKWRAFLDLAQKYQLTLST